MKEITQKRFFFMYGVSLIFYTELFMILEILIISFSKMAMIPTLLVLLMAPLLGGIVALNQSKKNKTIVLENNYQAIFFIINTILYLAIYFFNLKFNILLFLFFILGAVISCFINKRKIDKMKLEYREENKKDFFKYEQKIKKYEFEKFNIENIKEFFKINKIDTDKFLLGKVKPIKKEYVLWSDNTVLKYILCFNTNEIYFFEITKKTKEYIEKGLIIEMDKIFVKNMKEGMRNYKIEIEIENEGTRFYLYIPKKARNINMQNEIGKQLYKQLENKNTDRKEK